MIPRLRPVIGWPEMKAALRPRATVAEFEAAFAQLMGQSHALAFPYGRVGLLLLLKAMGIQDREVICPAYTCVVVAHAIVLSGNRPMFVDISDADFNMDLDRAEAAITERTAAIIATSIHGHPVDLDRLDALRQRHPHVRVIQDCAHSFAAEWQGRPVQRGGDATLFGFNISKLITSIFGGMVTTDDPDLAGRLRAVRDAQLSTTGRVRDFQRALYLVAATLALTPPCFAAVDRLRRLGLLRHFTDYYDPNTIDLPADHRLGMCRAEAAVGLQQIRRYPEIVAHRRTIARLYNALLEGCPGLRLPQATPGATYSHYVVRVADPLAVVAQAARRGIELGRVMDYCVPDMPAYKAFALCDVDFPVTRTLNRKIVNVPVHVSEDDARYIATVLRSILSANPGRQIASDRPGVGPKADASLTRSRMHGSDLLVQPADAGDVASIAALHASALPDDLLPQLGLRFLEVDFYAPILRDPDLRVTVARQARQVVGFVVLAKTGTALSRFLLRRPSAILPALLGTAWRKPSVLSLCLCTLLARGFGQASQSQGGSPCAEIAFIATASSCRGQGVGSELLRAALAEARSLRRGLLARTSSQAASRFYCRNGLRRIGEEHRCSRRFDVLCAPYEGGSTAERAGTVARASQPSQP